MKTLQIDKFNFFTDHQGFLHLNTFLKNNYNKKIFILVDSNTSIFCLDQFSLLFNIENKIILTIPAGESSKSVDCLCFLIDKLTHYNADSDSILINLGGGVISDLGGFLASIFNRGISYINIPTTLLAQVDASIGGKTGINFNGIKNKIGVINNPMFTIILTDFLKTLPEKEVISGYGEIFKYGLIYDPFIWSNISSNKQLSLDNIDKLIYQAVKIKTSIIQKDFKEKGLRNILNFGHTIGHAIESCYKDSLQISHGLSVVMGMICELYISHILLDFSKQDLNDVTKLLIDRFPLKKVDDVKNIINFIKQDKKNKNGKFLFSLIPEIGLCYFDQDVNEGLIYDSLIFYNNLHD